MALRFKVENFKAVPTPETYLVREVKELMAADRTTGKVLSHQILAYVRLYTDPTEDALFRNYEGEERERRCRMNVFGSDQYDFHPSIKPYVQALIDATEQDLDISEQEAMTILTLDRQLIGLRKAIDNIKPEIKKVVNPKTLVETLHSNGAEIAKLTKDYMLIKKERNLLYELLMKTGGDKKIGGGKILSLSEKGAYNYLPENESFVDSEPDTEPEAEQTFDQNEE